MAEISGLGMCGVCLQPLQDAVTGTTTAVRHWEGHTLAHKACYDQRKAYEQTHEYKVEKARKRLNDARLKLSIAQAEQEDAYAALMALDPSDPESLIEKALRSGS